MFSALDRILFAPLPYADEDRLVHFGMTFPFGGGSTASDILSSSPPLSGWLEAGARAVHRGDVGTDDACDITEQPSERLPCARVESNS
jgi:hypothetical protein